MFEVLGLTPTESALYAALVSNPRSSLTELAEHAAISAQQAALGLPTGSSSTDWPISCPARRRATSRLLRTSPSTRRSPGRKTNYARLARPAISRCSIPPVVAAYASRRVDGDHHRTGQHREPDAAVPRHGTHADQGFDRPPYAADPGSSHREEERLDDGVNYRVIYTPEAVDVARAAQGDIRAASERGEQARVRPNLPLKLVIVDDRLAFVPGEDRPASGGRRVMLFTRATCSTHSSRCSRASGTRRSPCGHSSIPTTVLRRRASAPTRAPRRSCSASPPASPTTESPDPWTRACAPPSATFSD